MLMPNIDNICTAQQDLLVQKTQVIFFLQHQRYYLYRCHDKYNNLLYIQDYYPLLHS